MSQMTAAAQFGLEAATRLAVRPGKLINIRCWSSVTCRSNDLATGDAINTPPRAVAHT